MGTVAAAAAIVIAEVVADDPLDVAVVAVELVVFAVELVAAVEGGEGVALGKHVVEQWVVVRLVGATPLPGCGSP